MIDLNLLLTWAKRIAFVVLIVLWRLEARQNERLLDLLQTNTDTTAECVVSYRTLVAQVIGSESAPLSAIVSSPYALTP